MTGTIESKLTGAGGLTKSGQGVLRLANTSNDFTGTITAVGAVLEMAVIPNSSSRIAFNGGTIRYVGATNTTTNRALQIGTVGGALVARLESSGAGTINYSSTAAATNGGIPTTGAGLRLGGSNTGDNYWRGALNDPSSIAIGMVKVDAGTWIVNGNSGYTGGTTISGGTLGFGSTTALGTGTVTFSANATLRAATAGSLSNIMSTGASSAVTATFDTQANAVTLSGSIGGSGNLAKIGSATLTLTSANNAYTGATTISSGTMALAGNGNIQSSSGVNLSASGATLDTTAAGLAIGASQTLAGTGTGWDFLDSTGSLTITASGGNPFTINMWSLSGLPDMTGNVSDFNPGSSSNFLIAEFDGGITGWDPAKFSLDTGAVNGTGGFTNDISGQGSFSLARGDTVSGGNANQIYIVYAAVPEPGTLALAGIGLAAAAWAVRRRRSSS